uniref:Uncharacterized protein LOC114334848 n=1 Tax=Diabrotica virgifera virgifera TaxID=50390 RepID=A0A6P7G7D4_DIAVI
MYKSRDPRSSRELETLSISSLSDIEDLVVNNGKPRDEARRKSSYNSRDRDPRNFHSEQAVIVDAILDPSVCDFQGSQGSDERLDYRDKRSNSDREGRRYRDRPSYEGKSYDDGRSGYRGKRKSSHERSEKADKRPVFDRLGYGAARSDHGTARSDHGTARSDHGTARSDHGTARSDQEERSHDRSDHKESKSTRLSRLEKMVELLVENTLESTAPAPPSLDVGNSAEVVGRSFNLTTSAWLNKISNACLEKNLDDPMCISFLQSNLTGLMKAWFKTVDAFEFTWPELKMLIIQTFPDTVDFAHTLRLLVDRLKQPSETITQYYFAKMYLAEACKISGSNAVSCLIDGLNDPDLQKYAREKNFISPETLYAQFLVKLPNYGITHPELAEHGEEREIEQRLRLPIIPCAICSRMNHATESCYHRKKVQKCYTCGKFGHLSKACFNNQ